MDPKVIATFALLLFLTIYVAPIVLILSLAHDFIKRKLFKK
jgi:hypothetical protein